MPSHCAETDSILFKETTTLSPPLTMPDLPIDSLKDFLEEVRKLFDNITYHWDQILIPAEFREPLVEAWDELRPAIPRLKDEVDSPNNETKLEEAGRYRKTFEETTWLDK
jgi:hypothetical protein